ncbi:IS110 family transposase [Pseudomonas aeruginosa]|uniref:IS110 family transposase n=1 Tax=Pseudomonas aeruginosa TaxID=287 RepID=UPI0021AEFFD3|nr:IS110 family transposase [Pseudomonas aeruginosa]
MKKSSSESHGLPVIHDRAAGIDIGLRFHVVAVSADITEESVQTFKAFTADVECMANWLVDRGITTVAMESTGVYWIPVYEILESHGLHVVLANARDARAVPGPKTDVNDVQWIQRLHTCGLLRASFHPDREIAALRSYLRLWERHLDYDAAHIQHMQKALTHMNLQLHHVVADITGATGMRILRAIVAGERNAATLATMRDTRCKSSVETIQSALVGNYQPEHVFALAQALAVYDAYQTQLEICDQQIAQSLQRPSQQKPPPGEPLPKPRHRTRQPNALNFDVRTLLYQLTGIDLT